MFDFELALGPPAEQGNVRSAVESELAARRSHDPSLGDVVSVTVTAFDGEQVDPEVAVRLGEEPAVWVLWSVNDKVGARAEFFAGVRAMLELSVTVARQVDAAAALIYAAERVLLTRGASGLLVYPGLDEWVSEDELHAIGVPYERTDDDGWL